VRNPALNPPNPNLDAMKSGAESMPAPTIPATSIPMLDLRAEFAEMESEVRTALDEVLVAQQFILGPQVAAFEQELAEYSGRRLGVGVASGTDALILGLRACGVRPGDEVIVPTFTFVATAGAVSALGARPVFADSEPETLNIDPDSVESHVTSRTKAIIAVHLYGLGADLAPLMEIASRHNVALIEDNAQSLGGTYQGRKLGSFGTVATTSFYPSKNLGAFGDGGMILTDSEQIAARLARLRNHGQSGRYVSSEPGWNSRLDEMQAAVLRVKLRYLERSIAARRAHAERYTKRFRGLPGVRTPQAPAGREHSYYLYTLRIASDTSKAGAATLSSRCDRVAERLTECGIASAVFYPVPLHLQPLYAALGGRPGDLPVAERAAHEVLSLPLYPSMTADQIDCVAGHVEEALRK
jgi:dTDP-4-amino-4,6-dideoxygalactose transaminase